MSNLDSVKLLLSSRFNIEKFQFTQNFGDNVLVIPKEDLLAVLSTLKQADIFDFLLDVCGVHYPNREKPFEVVYHLFSSKKRFSSSYQGGFGRRGAD